MFWEISTWQNKTNKIIKLPTSIIIIPSHKGGHPLIIENKFLIELETLDVYNKQFHVLLTRWIKQVKVKGVTGFIQTS